MMKKMMMMMMKMMMVMMMMMMMKMMIKSMLMTVFLMMYLENFLKQKAKIRIIIGETITTTTTTITTKTIKELIMVLEVNLTVRPVHPLIQVKHFYLRSKMLSTESGGQALLSGFCADLQINLIPLGYPVVFVACRDNFNRGSKPFSLRSFHSGYRDQALFNKKVLTSIMTYFFHFLKLIVLGFYYCVMGGSNANGPVSAVSVLNTGWYHNCFCFKYRFVSQLFLF